MIIYLWTPQVSDCPVPYVNMRFYKEFGWTPKELKEQNANDILDILTIWEAENYVNNTKGKSKQ